MDGYTDAIIDSTDAWYVEQHKRKALECVNYLSIKKQLFKEDQEIVMPLYEANIVGKETVDLINNKAERVQKQLCYFRFYYEMCVGRLRQIANEISQ